MFGIEKKKTDVLLTLMEKQLAVANKIIDRLEQENRELFDRLMARNWDQWASGPAVASSFVDENLVPRADEADNNEDNIGAIIE